MRYLIASVLFLTGCVIDTVPLPEETPEPDDEVKFTAEGDFIDESALYYSESPSLLVGAEWAVPALATVIVGNPDRQNWQAQAQSSNNGSFNLPLNAAMGDTIDISVVIAGAEVTSITLLLTPGSVAANRASADLDDNLEEDGTWLGVDAGGIELVIVSPPNAEGIVALDAPAGAVEYGIAVVIANRTGGAATITYARSDGSFSAHLAGNSGDELNLFGVEPASNNGGGIPVVVFVP